MRSTITLMLVCVGLYVLSQPFFNPQGFAHYGQSTKQLIEWAYIMGGLFLAGLALSYFLMFRRP